MKHSIGAFCIAALLMLIPGTGSGDQTALPDQATLRRWVAEMKASSRGPFQQIRWFCNDGSVHPPGEYVCRDRGGGIQHGEWSPRVRQLRENGYRIANVFADVRPEELLGQPESEVAIGQMVLEQYLVSIDDGWIFRKAQYYRGAFQPEDESKGGRNLLRAMAAEADWRTTRFLLVREAERYFPHGLRMAPVSAMRELSRELAEADPAFEPLRAKIHVRPEAGDAERVRRYAAQRGKKDLAADYQRLADIIHEVFQPRNARSEILALDGRAMSPALARQIREAAVRLAAEQDPAVRFQAGCRLLAVMREQLGSAGNRQQTQALLDASLALERDMFATAATLLDRLPRASRADRLSWLQAAADGLYGIGFVSGRQRAALQEAFDGISASPVALSDYKAALEYAARAPGWADRTLRFHFTRAADQLTVLEPLAGTYFHDRLRGSLLIVYSALLDGLLADANQQIGSTHRLMGQPVASGLTGLNPGIGRGVLKVARPGDDPKGFSRSGVYLLPATFEDLPPIAGIITADKGSMLSHVQLLARNLGIPNVAVDDSLLPQVTALEGQSIVLAVSPGGVVQIAADGPGWNEVFSQESKEAGVVIRPDLKKLDLVDRRLIPLTEVRAADSGRICGPKAANLGELKHHFPEAVTEGVVIPFAVFRAVLDQPLEPGGPTVFQWMQDQYALIRSLAAEPDRQRQASEQFLGRMRARIAQTDLGEDFIRVLRATMEKAFGPDGSYGVFVRSDTNVEDLPGFSGAGLNLTVMNVVGFDRVVEAIRQVWASPFTDRAYQWRQALMEKPEHVYVSVLLLKSVPSEKSGVMVTADVEGGRPGRLSVAVSEGVGGAVSGQTAEELRIDPGRGKTLLLAQATEPLKVVLQREGGIARVPASGTEAVLSAAEIGQLIDLAAALPQRFPLIQNAQGRPAPADVEFGFVQSRLVLFQIRPFLESAKARQNIFLNRLDEVGRPAGSRTVKLNEIPGRSG
ncbi:MAG: PEP/pyruvate-binding domain-containing protein [Hyphomicrobiales bacterium]